MPDSALSQPEAYHGAQAARATPGEAWKRLLELMDSANIAEDMTEEQRGRLGEKCLREFEVDLASRDATGWTEATKEALELASQVVKKKVYPWPKAANIKYPLLTTASIQFAARAYPAIINGPDVVKGRVRGNDAGIPLEQPSTPFGLQPAGQAPEGAEAFQVPQGPPIEAGQPMAQPGAQPSPVPPQSGMAPQQGQEQLEQQWEVPPGVKRARADRVARHMSYQLIDEMEEWEEEMDRLLHIVPIVCCAFKKTYFDPGLGRNRSELVLADKFVVNYTTKSLAVCPRATHVIELYPHEIEERFRDGRFVEFELAQPVGSEPDDEEAPHEFLEQHRLEDLDHDGYPEPYVVTIHKETSTVVRAVARFDEDSIQKGDDGRVSRIDAVQYFTKFGFIPSFDGGFYDMGFGVLLRPISEAINTSINMMLDAGHLQTTGGGFIGSGLRIKGGDTRFRPGELKRVTSVGGAIKDNIVMLDWPEPSNVLFMLLGMLVEAAKDITSVKDIMTGDAGNANEAASRTMARIEQGMKVFSAIYKRLFRSLKAEYKKLFRLNSLYLKKQDYFELLDEYGKSKHGSEEIGLADYNAEDLDILPVADPNMVTEMQRYALAEFLQTFINDPHVDPLEARKRIFMAAGVPDADELLVEEAPPDPTIAQAADEIEIKKKEVEVKGQKLEIDAQKVEVDGMKAQIERMKAEALIGEIKSKIVLNLAKAQEASDKTSILALSTLLDSINEHGRQSLETGKAMDAREANEQKAKTDERRIPSVAGSSGNGGGA